MCGSDVVTHIGNNVFLCGTGDVEKEATEKVEGSNSRCNRAFSVVLPVTNGLPSHRKEIGAGVNKLRETSMYERFSDRARKVMSIANQVARSYNHMQVDLEHIIFGIVRERGGVAVKLLESMKVSPADIECRLEKLMVKGSEASPIGKIPLSPAAKTLMDYAMEEATTDDSGILYVGTEHLLLGLLRPQRDATTGQKTTSHHQIILKDVGLTYEAVKEKLITLVPEELDKHLVAQQKAQVQGLLDIFRLFDKETVQKIEEIVKAIDVDKVKKVFDAVEIDDDGWIKIHLGVKK